MPEIMLWKIVEFFKKSKKVFLPIVTIIVFMLPFGLAILLTVGFIRAARKKKDDV